MGAGEDFGDGNGHTASLYLLETSEQEHNSNFVDKLLGRDEDAEYRKIAAYAKKGKWNRVEQLAIKTRYGTVAWRGITECVKEGIGKTAMDIAIARDDPGLIVCALDGLYSEEFKKIEPANRPHQLVDPGWQYDGLVYYLSGKRELREKVITGVSQFGSGLHIFNRLAAVERGGTTDSRVVSILRDSIASEPDMLRWMKYEKSRGREMEVAMAFAAFGPVEAARKGMEKIASSEAWDAAVWVARFTHSKENALLAIDAAREAGEFNALREIIDFDMRSKEGMTIPEVKAEAKKAIASIVTNGTVETILATPLSSSELSDAVKAIVSYGSLPVAKKMVSAIASLNDDAFKYLTEGGRLESCAWEREENEREPLRKHMELVTAWRRADAECQKKAGAWLGANQFKQDMYAQRLFDRMAAFDNSEKKRAEAQKEKTETAGKQKATR